VPLPAELLDAIGRVLDDESNERDSQRRAQLLAVVRATVDRWLRGEVSTADALTMLDAAHARVC
jgi:hypothetical protein